MNILILSWRGPGHPIAGGAEQVTHEHAKAWVKAGHGVTLFTSSYQGAKPEESIDGVDVIRRANQTFGVQIAAFFWYLFGSHEKFDLVVDQFHGIPFFTPLHIRTKKLAFIHEVTKEVWRLNPWPKPFNLIPAIVGTFFESSVFRLLYRRIPFITVSDSTKRDLVAWGIPEENINVIPNGVKLSLSKKKPAKEKLKTAMFLGALSQDKGTEDAIKAFSLIDGSENNWQFWIVGNGENNYLAYLKGIVGESGLDKKVKFWGFVGDKKKFELLARAHVMVNPSIREGWGLVNIEANSVGTPVVGFDVPGTRDSIVSGETGILVEKGDTDSLASSVVELVNNKTKYAKIRKNCREWSKKFDWKRSTEISLKIIANL